MTFSDPEILEPPVRIAVASVSFCASPELIARLATLSPHVRINDSGSRLGEDELMAFLSGCQAEIAIVGLEPFSDRVMAACPTLRFVSKYGVGLDNLDLGAMERRGVKLGWTAGVNRRSVSELVLGFALGHCRNLLPSVACMRQGLWIKRGGVQLSGQTVGLVGFGNVGTDVARLLRPFGCTVLYSDIVDRTGEAAVLGAEAVDYRELLAASDIVSFHVPRTPLTIGMYGPAAIAITKRDALIINTSRGDVVDFDATIEAVRSGALGGFAADVFPDEPFDASALAGMSNVYFTPHIGGNAREAILAMGHSAIDHAQAYVRTRYSAV